jgi:hypothetical protein
MKRAGSVFGLVIFEFIWAFAFVGCSRDGNSSDVKSISFNLHNGVDILLVVDNSGSMVGEQLQLGKSFAAFSQVLEERFRDNYHIAVITTGIESENCPRCDEITGQSCINETLEDGRFQDRIGINLGTEFEPDYQFETEPSCRIVTQANKDCFYDESDSSGIVLDGVTGCGYERGLEAIRMALQEDNLSTYNEGFFREDASLAIIVISDEDDCGNVGDVNETLSGIMADVCYYAAKGEDPDGNTTDPEGKAYSLTPVQEYYDFLVGLKGEGNVKFAAIVGMEDPSDPGASEITYEEVNFPDGTTMMRPKSACFTPGCEGMDAFCSAKPGTRYIDLAQMFGANGYIDTICQEDFSDTMAAIGTFVACPDKFALNQAVSNSALETVTIGDTEFPKYSCAQAVNNELVACDPNEAGSCLAGECKPTWIYCPPDGGAPDVVCSAERNCSGLTFENAPGGYLQFCEHSEPCKFAQTGVEM